MTIKTPAPEGVAAEAKSVMTEKPAASVVAKEDLIKQTPPSAAVVAKENLIKQTPPAAAVVAKEEFIKPSTSELTAIHIPEATKEAPPPAAAPAQTVSFEEQSNVAVDPKKKALDELKELVHAALANNEFDPPPPPAKEEKPEAAPSTEPAPPPLEAAEAKAAGASVKEQPLPPTPALTVEKALPAPPTAAEPVSIWGVPLLADERSDAVLLKFLRARDFKPKEAFAMLKNTVIWRKQFGIDAVVNSGEPELEKAVFMYGKDKEGHPVCYNVYGEFQDKELYEKTFGDDEKREKFLKWRIHYLEKGIRELLDFSGGGAVCSMVQVTDMKNSPKQGKHRQVAGQALTLLQDNYPEFIAKKVFVNVSWWSLNYYKMKINSFFTQRTKSKFVFAGPSRTAETLFKFIAPEQVPIAYGGLGQENGSDFAIADAATLITIRASSKESIEIPVSEGSSQLIWELRVVGWGVSYGAEFVPDAEDGYTVIVQKAGKVAAAAGVVKGSYKIDEAGKVVINIENPTPKRKVAVYRYKIESSTKSS